MNKQEFIERMKSLKNIFGNKCEYIEIDAVIELASELDEPQKVAVPQYIADWIEYCKCNNLTLLGCLDPLDDFGTALAEGFEGDTRKCLRWCRRESDKFARAWLDGYTVEKEKKYLVKMKGIKSEHCYLKRIINNWIIAEPIEHTGMDIHTKHTRKELEVAGFGEVFNSPLFEVEEVE